MTPPVDDALRTAVSARFGDVLSTEAVDGLDGIRVLFHGAGFTAMGGTAARIAAEERGASSGHRLAPRWIGAGEGCWAIERASEPCGDPVAAIVASAGGRTDRITAPLGALLAQPDVVPSRALARCELSRSAIDRALAAEVTIELEIGPTLGGTSTAHLRARADGSPLALTVRRAEAAGWPVLDLAALAVRGQSDARDAFVERGDEAARGRAWAVACLRVALRELVLGKDASAADVALEHFASFDVREPERVRLSIDAPAWLDRARYGPLGEVSASHARFVMRAIDGIILGGQQVTVRVEPPVRPGRVARPFEPLESRIERIFGHRDALYDDEGLYSATEVKLARDVVRGLRGVVIDGTCGLGCLAMAAADLPGVTKVIAIERDAGRMRLAAHDIGLRGLSGKIELMHGDVRALLPTLRGDALILDPPWGGREYPTGAVSLSDLPLDVGPLIEGFAGAVRLKLPRGLDVATLPAGMTPRAAIDERGLIKFLIAER